jgi:hypothetical protein
MKPDDASDPASQPSPAASKQRQLGRRLKLTFRGGDRPELQKIQFCFDDKSKFTCYEKGVTSYFGWSEVPWALSLLFLDYVYHGLQKPRDQFKFDGGTVNGGRKL